MYKNWNRVYQQKYTDDPAKLEERFDKTVPETSRLNLKRLWVITSKVTASAAEMLISALSPYMEVNTVGDVTMGKNMGGIIYTPEEKDLQGWNIMLISTEYTNSRNESVMGGLVPKYPMLEQFHHQYQLGDPQEPLLATTLQLISRKPVATPNRMSRSVSEEGKLQRVIPPFVQAKSVLIFGMEK